ncbi:hypothetical protein KIPB_006655 [Kipferlia bialata]|uniref:Uncharacterized protein n=1 Tax=Kipferlia bialata TaxID=797122 RepID=A0A9K3CZZ0_9EUKA|nr:hypothetical protein KIPB_006655 [Kipferlia bialata]|eukprot:g6655.t1
MVSQLLSVIVTSVVVSSNQSYAPLLAALCSPDATSVSVVAIAQACLGIHRRIAGSVTALVARIVVKTDALQAGYMLSFVSSMAKDAFGSGGPMQLVALRLVHEVLIELRSSPTQIRSSAPGDSRAGQPDLPTLIGSCLQAALTAVGGCPASDPSLPLCLAVCEVCLSWPFGIGANGSYALASERDRVAELLQSSVTLPPALWPLLSNDTFALLTRTLVSVSAAQGDTAQAMRALLAACSAINSLKGPAKAERSLYVFLTLCHALPSDASQPGLALPLVTCVRRVLEAFTNEEALRLLFRDQAVQCVDAMHRALGLCLQWDTQAGDIELGTAMPVLAALANLANGHLLCEDRSAYSASAIQSLCLQAYRQTMSTWRQLSVSLLNEWDPDAEAHEDGSIEEDQPAPDGWSSYTGIIDVIHRTCSDIEAYLADPSDAHAELATVSVDLIRHCLVEDVSDDRPQRPCVIDEMLDADTGRVLCQGVAHMWTRIDRVCKQAESVPGRVSPALAICLMRLIGTLCHLYVGQEDMAAVTACLAPPGSDGAGTPSSPAIAMIQGAVAVGLSLPGEESVLAEMMRLLTTFGPEMPSLSTFDSVACQWAVVVPSAGAASQTGPLRLLGAAPLSIRRMVACASVKHYRHHLSLRPGLTLAHLLSPLLSLARSILETMGPGKGPLDARTVSLYVCLLHGAAEGCAEQAVDVILGSLADKFLSPFSLVFADTSVSAAQCMSHVISFAMFLVETFALSSTPSQSHLLARFLGQLVTSYAATFPSRLDALGLRAGAGGKVPQGRDSDVELVCGELSLLYDLVSQFCTFSSLAQDRGQDLTSLVHTLCMTLLPQIPPYILEDPSISRPVLSATCALLGGGLYSTVDLSLSG